MKDTQEIYISTDIETDGPIPGENSMLSFGSVAFAKNENGEFEILSVFSANLNTLVGATADPETAKWWETQPAAWEACRKELQDPAGAMKAYVFWLKNLPGKPVFVGYPAGFDFLFIYWYLIKFAKESPFSFSALDIKTYAMAVLKSNFRDTTKKTMPKSWFPKCKHTHIAIDDAIEQGWLFINMLEENMKAKEI